MKEIVDCGVLKRYLVARTQTYDDFLTLRRSLSYHYGVLQCLNYALAVHTELGRFMLDLRTGAVSVCQLSFSSAPELASPFAIRFSRNIFELFGKTYINAGVLPAFLATADALTNRKYSIPHADSTSRPSWNFSMRNSPATVPSPAPPSTRGLRKSPPTTNAA
jgi:hypothetical protein